MPLKIGEIYDERYEIVQQIIEGGEGTVFLAQDKKLMDHKVAIKECHVATAEDRSRIEKEARILIECSHDNLPRIFGIFETPDHSLCLVMDYIQGENLHQKRIKGPLPHVELVQCFSQISDTLNFLHDHGVIHGDIKPKNIIISEKEPYKAYLVDFGSSKVHHTGEGNGVLINDISPDYAAPEQYYGKLDPRSDIYSLGATLYTLLTGKIFDPSKTIKLSGQAAQYATVISKSLMHAPGERYQTARDFKMALEGVRWEPFIPEFESISAEISGPKKPISVKALTIIAGVCVLAILGIWILLTRPWDISESTTTSAAETIASVAMTVAQSTTAYLSTDTKTSLPSLLTDVKGVEMVLVPAGEFMMGSTDANMYAQSDEKPQHKVYLDAYYIDLTEVTNAMYLACVEAGACTPPGNTSSSKRDRYYGFSIYDDYPVIYINWDQTVAYCEWRGARLPTEAEWEKAARGTDGRTYPWGEDDPDCTLANYYNNATNSYCVGDTSEVSSYPRGASPYGLQDMAGNVWEWVQDWYLDTFYQNSPFENPVGPSLGRHRVARGGSWGYRSFDARAALRLELIPSGRYDDLGFRCARSP
jgi:formylglycine-generating enzyme required for sulfatase activity/predicted Ser/Thr protein kinase